MNRSKETKEEENEEHEKISPSWYPIPKNKKKFDLLLNEIEQQFDTMKWVKYPRYNISYKPCYSMTFGEVMRPYYGRCASVSNEKFPDLYLMLQALSKMLHFSHSSYTVNKNIECLPHKDKNNIGDSLILALGSFSGGRLFVEGQKFNIYRRPLQFNGSLLTHWTEPFDGSRYTIVFYNIKTKKKSNS